VRAELLPHRIDLSILCAGSEGNASREIALSEGADYIEVANFPVSNKRNQALRAVHERYHQVDAVIISDSDDIASADYFIQAVTLLRSQPHVSIVRVDALHSLDVVSGLGLYSDGYLPKARQKMTMALALVLRAEVMDRVLWSPWKSGLNRSLDADLWPTLGLAYGYDGRDNMTIRLCQGSLGCQNGNVFLISLKDGDFSNISPFNLYLDSCVKGKFKGCVIYDAYKSLRRPTRCSI
jgi:hypothetical protein